MAVRVRCPNAACAATMKLEPGQVGRVGLCPRCRRPLIARADGTATAIGAGPGVAAGDGGPASADPGEATAPMFAGADDSRHEGPTVPPPGESAEERPSPEPHARSPRRRRAVAGLVAVAVLLMATTAAVFVRWRPEEERSDRVIGAVRATGEPGGPVRLGGPEHGAEDLGLPDPGQGGPILADRATPPEQQDREPATVGFFGRPSVDLPAVGPRTGAPAPTNQPPGRQQQEQRYRDAIRIAYKALVVVHSRDEAIEELKNGPLEFRDWAWRYCRRLAAPELRSLSEGEAGVTGVAFLPTGTLIAAAGLDAVIRLWDERSAQVAERIVGHKGPIRRLIALPARGASGPALIATAGDDGTIRIWDVSSVPAREVRVLVHGSPVVALAADPSGMLLVSGGDDGSLALWAPYTGIPIRHRRIELGGDPGAALAREAAGDAKMVDVLRAEEQRIPGIPFDRRPSRITAVAFVPGTPFPAIYAADRAGGVGLYRIVLDEAFDQQQRLAELVLNPRADEFTYHNPYSTARNYTRQVPGTLSSTSVVDQYETVRVVRSRSASLAPGYANDILPGDDGRSLWAASEDHTIRRLSLLDGVEAAPLIGHNGWVNVVRRRPGPGWLLATGGEDRTVRLWKAVPGGVEPAAVYLAHDDAITSIDFSPDGRLVASGSLDATVKLWDATAPPDGRVLRLHDGPIRALAFSPIDGRLAIAGGDGLIRFCDPTTGQPAGPALPHRGPVDDLAFSDDGQLFAAACRDGRARVWSRSGRSRPVVTLEHRGPVHRVSFRAGTHLLATDGTSATGSPCALLWNLDLDLDPDETIALHQDGPRCRELTFDLPLPSLAPAVIRSHRQALFGLLFGAFRVETLRFSRDGHHLIVGLTDRSLRVHHLDCGEECRAIRSAPGLLVDSGDRLDSGPDGRMVASTTAGGAVRVWDVREGATVAVLKGHEGPIRDVTLCPDGRSMVTVGRDGAVKVWNLILRSPVLELPADRRRAPTVAAFGPRGALLAVGYDDGTVVVRTGSEELEFPGERPAPIAAGGAGRPALGPAVIAAPRAN